MQKTKFITVVALGLLLSVGCKKEDMSKYATKDDIANMATKDDIDNNKVKEIDFNLTFTTSDLSLFGPTIYKNNPQDIVLTFVKWNEIGGDPTWAQCPVTAGNVKIVPEFLDYSLIINVMKADGTSGSPLTQTTTYAFRAIIIPVNEMSKHPNVNLLNYKEVCTTFDLK